MMNAVPLFVAKATVIWTSHAAPTARSTENGNSETWHTTYLPYSGARSKLTRWWSAWTPVADQIMTIRSNYCGLRGRRQKWGYMTGYTAL
ncbi:hypothetical protein M8818_007073 [Zalaria obscura]|uniref:Uncharacterized protein n=1 Tax=Zalaria obscura TaxID=2024903 RepID=A0ACC3S4U5_9PEZI